jgi:hypothetical protein
MDTGMFKTLDFIVRLFMAGFLSWFVVCGIPVMFKDIKTWLKEIHEEGGERQA